MQPFWALPVHVGGCQNYGSLLGSLDTRCRIILRTQKGTIILTTTHVHGGRNWSLCTGSSQRSCAYCWPRAACTPQHPSLLHSETQIREAAWNEVRIGQSTSWQAWVFLAKTPLLLRRAVWEWQLSSAMLHDMSVPAARLHCAAPWLYLSTEEHIFMYPISAPCCIKATFSCCHPSCRTKTACHRKAACMSTSISMII